MKGANTLNCFETYASSYRKHYLEFQQLALKRRFIQTVSKMDFDCMPTPDSLHIKFLYHLYLCMSSSSTPIFLSFSLSFGPEANMVHYIFNAVCNCLASSTCQEQISFPERSFMFGVQGSQSALCECCTKHVFFPH